MNGLIVSFDSNQFIDFPKMKDLIHFKNKVNIGRNHPPMYVTLDYKRYSLTQFGKFDAIWINPPLQEYVDRILPTKGYKLHEKLLKTLQPWDFELLKDLPVKELADSQ